MNQWGTCDGTFSLIHFYHIIVKTLSDTTDEWVAETMKWWKRYAHLTLILAHTTHQSPHSRKLLGDGGDASNTNGKRMRISANTAYRLMMKQSRVQVRVGS